MFQKNSKINQSNKPLNPAKNNPVANKGKDAAKKEIQKEKSDWKSEGGKN